MPIHRAVPLRGGIKKTDLIEALQYSGAELTEDMTDEEILAALAAEFPPYTYLFRANKTNLLTGTWKKNNAQGGTITTPAVNNEGNLEVALVSGEVFCNYICQTAVDVTNYSKLFFTVANVPEESTNANKQINVGLSASYSNTTVMGSLGASVNIDNNTGTFEVDISSLTGVYYFGFSIAYFKNSTLEFSEIYLQ